MTLKGAERRAVVLKTPENGIFEEAVFLMRVDPEIGGEEEELVRTAGRIVEENLISRKKKGGNRGKTLSFFLGFLFGLLPGMILWLAFRF